MTPTANAAEKAVPQSVLLLGPTSSMAKILQVVI